VDALGNPVGPAYACPIGQPVWATFGYDQRTKKLGYGIEYDPVYNLHTIGPTAVCSGSGNCSRSSLSTPPIASTSPHGWHYVCNCTGGTAGGACEEKQCPSGRAWHDTPLPDGTSHREAACSGRGSCDEVRGVCECDDGFEGPACEQMSCATNGTVPCGGVGRCLTMFELSRRAERNGEPRPLNYSDSWESHKLKGCLCDAAGGVGSYPGWDCSDRRARARQRLSLGRTKTSGSLHQQYETEFPSPSGRAHDTTTPEREGADRVGGSVLTIVRKSRSNRCPKGRSFRPRAHPSVLPFPAPQYRGPWAFASTDWAGYDCSQSLCPTGDDPRTQGVLWGGSGGRPTPL